MLDWLQLVLKWNKLCSMQSVQLWNNNFLSFEVQEIGWRLDASDVDKLTVQLVVHITKHVILRFAPPQLTPSIFRNISRCYPYVITPTAWKTSLCSLISVFYVCDRPGLLCRQPRISSCNISPWTWLTMWLQSPVLLLKIEKSFKKVISIKKRRCCFSFWFNASCL